MTESSAAAASGTSCGLTRDKPSAAPTITPTSAADARTLQTVSRLQAGSGNKGRFESLRVVRAGRRRKAQGVTVQGQEQEHQCQQAKALHLATDELERWERSQQQQQMADQQVVQH